MTFNFWETPSIAVPALKTAAGHERWSKRGKAGSLALEFVPLAFNHSSADPVSGLSTNEQSVCNQYRIALNQRRHASAAAAVAETGSQANPVSQSPSPKEAYQINAGVVLSRPPQITRDLTSFEKAFFFYQRRLNERLALPFTRYFYFKKGTPADLEWKQKVKQRQTAARDIGVYNAYSKEGWNDEVLVGAKESEPEVQVQALLDDAEVHGTETDQLGEAKREPVERPMPRVTEADRTGDVKSLDRSLQRTLYLLVRGKDGRWVFPTSQLVGRENLHQVRHGHNYSSEHMVDALNIGCGADIDSGWRSQYEYMDGRKCANWTPKPSCTKGSRGKREETRAAS